MLGDKRFIHKLRLRNILSFGNDSEEVELKSLNVIVGPNASGKSNFIEMISLLRQTPKEDLYEPIRKGGGISEWLWKGSDEISFGEVNATIDFPDGIMPLRHILKITIRGQHFQIYDESIQNEHTYRSESSVYFFYKYYKGKPLLYIRLKEEDQAGTVSGRITNRQYVDFKPNQSILSQRKDPFQYPEITYLANQFSKIKLYREWNLGRNMPPRRPQPADLPGDFLLEDASNLGMVLNNLENQYYATYKKILKKLNEFYEGFENITINILGGTVQIFLHEKGLSTPIPATRLSDGTLRYLCLLTILCPPISPIRHTSPNE